METCDFYLNLATPAMLNGVFRKSTFEQLSLRMPNRYMFVNNIHVSYRLQNKQVTVQVQSLLRWILFIFYIYILFCVNLDSRTQRQLGSDLRVHPSFTV